MTFKFEKLEVWGLALGYVDLIYQLADKLPHNEDFNLKLQIIRAATSVALNIAEGSTGQSDREQNRFLGLALRSLIETVACQRLIAQRSYLKDDTILQTADREAQILARKINAFRKSLSLPDDRKVGEETGSYILSSEEINN